MTFSLSLSQVKCFDETLQPDQINPGFTLKTGSRSYSYSLRFLLDAALIPLIEDLFKELAMIEACNKVRIDGKGDTVLTFEKSIKRSFSKTLFKSRNLKMPA